MLPPNRYMFPSHIHPPIHSLHPRLGVSMWFAKAGVVNKTSSPIVLHKADVENSYHVRVVAHISEKI